MVIQRSPFEGMREIALFAGAGGGILGGHLLGWETICAVERDAYAASVLAQRQNDGILKPFPIWADVCSFDGRPWSGIADVVSGGFPCQDISVAGSGGGIDGLRSGLWSQMARIVGESRPTFVWVENSPALTSRGLGRVLGDLAALGYDTEWMCLSAGECGAPHKRDRIWILAYSDRLRKLQPEWGISIVGERPCDGCGFVFDHDSLGRYGCPNCEGEGLADSDRDIAQGLEPESQPPGQRRQAGLLGGAPAFRRWPADPAETPESGLDRMAYGLADWLDSAVPRVTDISKHRADRIKAIGNGQVPRVAAAAFSVLAARFGF